jgi:D-aspartate ligase
VPALVAGDLTLVRPLGWHKIPVVLVTTDGADPSLRSRYVKGHCLVPGFLPPDDGPALEVLAAAGERLRSALGRCVPLIYGQDSQLEFLYRHRETLAQWFLFVLNDQALALALHDKGRFFSLCECAGVRVPRTVVPQIGQSLEHAIERLRPPLVVKPREKSDWKDLQATLFEGKAKARVFATRDELLRLPGLADVSDRLIVQEYVEAPVTGLYSFHGFAGPDGRLLAWFCGRKLRTFPAVAGESAIVELVHDPGLETEGRAVVERLGIRGPFKVDLIRDARTGELFTLEVNARFNLWHHLGAAHGVNLPLVAYELLADGHAPSEPPGYRPRQRWVDLYRVYRASREDPSFSAMAWVWSLLLGRTLDETFEWADPLPFLTSTGQFLRERFGK